VFDAASDEPYSSLDATIDSTESGGPKDDTGPADGNVSTVEAAMGADVAEEAASPPDAGSGTEGASDVGTQAEGATDASEPAALCTSTGGQVAADRCCATVKDFPFTCYAGACDACAPADTHSVSVCSCPVGQCFSLPRGCAPSSSCTPGMDVSCNDDPSISSVRGQCGPDMKCSCVAGATLNATTGKCR
jgi:hypothetical protein